MGRTWICAQLGAREHYAVPRALHRSGRMKMLFTELWAGPVLRQFAFGPFRSLAARYHSDLACADVTSWNWTVLAKELERRSPSRRSSPLGEGDGCRYGGFINEGQWFSERVRDHLAAHKIDLR